MKTLTIPLIALILSMGWSTITPAIAQERGEPSVVNLSEPMIGSGQAYLAAQRSRPTVKETESGLLYWIVKSGPESGQHPRAESMVRVHYEGALTNGQVFDSSYRRGTPNEFPANRLIPGWTEVLQLMRPGDVWMIYLKPELAYGARGAGDVIGPNAVLVFKIELLEVLS
jgi:FKBP-type peptidyl-prolyl cis-trans isomerase FklB